MKKIFIQILVWVTFFCSGCESILDVEPENAVTYTNYFKSVQDAEALLASLQSRLKSLEMGSDAGYPMVHCGAAIIADVYNSTLQNYRNMNPLTYRNNNSSESRCYEILEAAHMIIDNAHRFELSKEIVQLYVLQAHFGRALAYFRLAQIEGEAPIVRDFTDYVALPQSPVKEILDEAEKSALIAMELPVYEDLKDGNGHPRTSKQYASKGAVAALLAHVYAYRAAVENESKYWEEAEKYCTMIIKGEVGNYTLAASPQDLCNTVLKGESSEGIWEILQSVEAGEFDGFSCPESYYEQEFFTTYPVRTESFMKPNSNSYSTQLYKETVNRMFDVEDRRREAYFYGLDADSLYAIYDQRSGSIVAKYSVKKGDETFYYRLNRKTWKIEPENELLQPGDLVDGKYDNTKIKMAFVLKYRFPYYEENEYSQELQYTGMNMNRVVWRLADIYLLRAECRAYRSNAGASDDLNEIRHRAYGNDKRRYTTAEGDIKLAIFREREKELLFEGHRWNDVIRNGRNHLNGHVGYDFIRKELSPTYSKLTDQDILDGALYMPVSLFLFLNNELILQKVYWNGKLQ